jgi:pyridoxamine 5'-phosphate oxidase
MIDDPWILFAAWMAEAETHEPRVPNAMQVATATPDGVPFVRTVLLKDFGPDGLTFYTNLESRKGKQLLLNPHVAFVLHFKSLERQILGEGRVSQVGDLTADAYFATRPRGSQIGAWASPQSREIPDRDVLVARVAEFEAKFEGGPVPRPPHWSGFRITPSRLEFWQGHTDRLHDRRSFAWQGNGWVPALLAP